MTESRLMTADLHGLAGLVDELVAVLSDLAEASRSEPGCRSFRVLRTEEPTEIVVLSEWASETAVRSHYDSIHYRRYREAVGPLLARPSDVVVFDVREVIHAADPNQPAPGMLG